MEQLEAKVYSKRSTLPPKDSDLLYEKMRGLATDGASSMVGREKGFVALVKNEFKKLISNPENLVVRLCFIWKVYEHTLSRWST